MSTCANPLTACALLALLKVKLAPILGKYTYSNGFVDPAITVANTPDEIEVEGLEVIIPLLPKENRKISSTSSYTEEVIWTIYLIDHNKGRSLPGATRILDSMFVKSRKQFYPETEDLKTPQVVFQFFHYQTTDL